MLKKQSYFVHSAFLIAIFIVGNTLIYFPMHNDIKSSILGVLIASAVSLLVYIAFAFLTKKIKSVENFKWARPIVVISIIITAFLVSLISAGDYISYVIEFRMDKTPKIIIAVLFLALCFYLANQSSRVILKLALITFIYVFLSITIWFLLSFSQLDFKSALPLEFKLFDVAKSFLTVISQSFLSVVVLIIFLNANKTKTSIKMWLIGLMLGMFILMVCMLNILFVFGPDLSNRLDLPYASAMSVINMGKTFSRLEGFSYLNYFACSLIKASSALWVIKKVFNEYFKKHGTTFIFILSLILVLLSLVNNISSFLYSISFSVVLLLLEFITLMLMGGLYKPNINSPLDD